MSLNGEKGRPIEEPPEITGSLLIEAKHLARIIRENEELKDEVKFLTAKLDQEQQINQLLKRMILDLEIKLEKFTKSNRTIG
jgi:cell division septum initiation protein DivIVA